MADETVSSNRILLYFLKLVCNFFRLLANHSSAISEGHLPVIPANVYTQLRKGSFSSLCPHFKVPLTKHGEPHLHSSLNPYSCPATSYYSRSI